MVRRARIGELLSRIVPLSGHDVEEILEEQSANRRKFGEIALAWGLCRPEHVWDAWCQQSEMGTVRCKSDGSSIMICSMGCNETGCSGTTARGPTIVGRPAGAVFSSAEGALL